MIIYTDHAEERMAGRGIRKARVEEVITKPDKVMDVKYGRKQAVKKIHGEEINQYRIRQRGP